MAERPPEFRTRSLRPGKTIFIAYSGCGRCCHSPRDAKIIDFRSGTNDQSNLRLSASSQLERCLREQVESFPSPSSLLSLMRILNGVFAPRGKLPPCA
ncbi:hypothetical protein PDE_00847 [Penicillium oxalicum 114-2]|uniref:Uncharacterized protein n=1 Tax=Penicillium oxalicum (strain 114-2 / CGMCC 5302) TaxID=933388 RepID=S7ZB62_PENO1|nr:hypothetical protein PDE_00847 [Penicillium oxalicum 114-2]